MSLLMSNVELSGLNIQEADDGCVSQNQLELSYTGLAGDGKPSGYLIPLYDRIDEQCEHECDAAKYGEEWTLNRNGPMSAEKKVRLQLSQRRIPRYLFRIFSTTSGGDDPKAQNIKQELYVKRSGVIQPALNVVGQQCLNCGRTIRSHAAFDQTMHNSIYEMNEEHLSDMLIKHLCTEHDVRSEFTSWAANLLWSMQCGNTEGDHRRIAIVDTRSFKKHHASKPLDIFHVPQLWRAGLSMFVYDHEYLIHSDVSGRGYDYFTLDFDRATLMRFINSSDTITPVEKVTKDAMGIAEPLRAQCAPTTQPGVYIYMVAMLLGLRYYTLPVHVFESRIPQISLAILGFDVKNDQSTMKNSRTEWGLDETIMTDLVYAMASPRDVAIRMATRVLRYMAIPPKEDLGMTFEWAF